MNLQEVFKILSEDKVFFEKYEQRFVEEFQTLLVKEREDMPIVNTLIVRLYRLLFSFTSDPTRELYSLASVLAKKEVDFKRILMSSCFSLIKAYVDYTKDQVNLLKVKALIDLISYFSTTVEKAYSSYVSSLKERIRQIEGETKVKDREEAINLISKVIEKAQGKVVIHYKYKGLIVDIASRLIRMDQGKAVIRTDHVGSYKEGDNICLKIPLSTRPVAGKIVSRDLNASTITVEITGFEDLPEERRRFVRVIPEGEVYAEVLRENRQKVKGIVADVSVRGVGVYAEDPSNIESGENVEVLFELEGKPIKVKGVVRHVSPHGSIFRIGIELEPDVKTEDTISAYVVRRQILLLKEFREF